jgi:SAM-dependent methyltransferase
MDRLEDAHYEAVTAYFRRFFDDLGVPKNAKLLDFGCGFGLHMRAYMRAGFDAYGCDISEYRADDRVKMIERSPYRIPYDDAQFDLVVSTSVLEHAQNTEEIFREIHRVLKPGGLAIHHFPTRWYLPREPHIYVPLANFFCPDVPRWWLKLWARLGVRNEFQQGLSDDEVVKRNVQYCRDGLWYMTCGQYERISNAVYGNCEWAMTTLIKHSDGGFASLARKIPFLPWGFIGRHFRLALMVHRKH